MAEVVLAKPAADALRALPPPLDEAALDALTVLESDPEAGNALRGRLRGVRSLRLGSFRFLYTIHDNAALIRVRAIRHRSVALARGHEVTPTGTEEDAWAELSVQGLKAGELDW